MTDDFVRRNAADRDKKLAAVRSGELYFPLHALTLAASLQSLSVAVSANTDLVAAMPGQRIYVFAAKIIAQADSTIRFASGSTPLEGAQFYEAHSGFCEAVTPPAFLFCTAIGESLSILCSGDIRGRISFWIA